MKGWHFAVVFNPVHVSAGCLSALQKIALLAKKPFAAFLLPVLIVFSANVCDGKSVRKMGKEKRLGQIFTPEYLVKDILDIAGYKPSSDIRAKHVIDNSCGDGAFLIEVVRRYCRATGQETKILKRELETYIHGIELDPIAYHDCMANLNAVVSEFGLSDIQWDVRNADTLTVTDYDGRMDYVVGNPPYVRVHNLEGNFERVKQYRFCSGGMTDLYLLFYEIGLKMLKQGGKLCYIAPSSWFNSVAGHNMREYVYETGTLRKIVDLGHFQPFNATAYTAIVLLEKAREKDFVYATYSGEGSVCDIARLSFDDCYFDNALYLGDKKTVAACREIKTGDYPNVVEVKNGFATLADEVFIANEFPFTEMTIPVIKASTGKWRKAFYPYNQKGRPLSREVIFSNEIIAAYLDERKLELLKGHCEDQNPEWYLYGRTQALKDVWRDKYAVNIVVRDTKSIKLNKVKAGAGVYSGLYILTEASEDEIREALSSDEFIEYIRTLRKYKSGGYYTFNSKDLKQFLNFRLRKRPDEMAK